MGNEGGLACGPESVAPVGETPRSTVTKDWSAAICSAPPGWPPIAIWSSTASKHSPRCSSCRTCAATRLGVTNSGAHACEDKKVRITNPGVPSATYLMVVRGAQSLRLSMLARFCEPAQSSHRRCSQRPLNHADAQRFLAPSPKAQSPTTNLALSSTRGTRGTRQADPLDPTALVYAYV